VLWSQATRDLHQFSGTRWQLLSFKCYSNWLGERDWPIRILACHFNNHLNSIWHGVLWIKLSLKDIILQGNESGGFRPFAIFKSINTHYRPLWRFEIFANVLIILFAYSSREFETKVENILGDESEDWGWCRLIKNPKVENLVTRSFQHVLLSSIECLNLHSIAQNRDWRYAF
jgi:hypothetical protein